MACLSLTAGHMSRGEAVARGTRKRLSAQKGAVEQLRAVAEPFRIRVQPDAEGFPIIPGR